MCSVQADFRCQPCWTAYEIGGFAAKYGSWNDFQLAAKNDKSLNDQLAAAVTALLKAIENGTFSRMSQKVKSSIADKLEMAKKEVVDAYEREELEDAISSTMMGLPCNLLSSQHVMWW